MKKRNIRGKRLFVNNASMPINNQTTTKIAKEYGFDLIGFAEAKDLNLETSRLAEWLNEGYHAGMDYMARNLEKRKDIKKILPSAKSVISLGLNYYTPEKHSEEKDKGKVSRYAWGKDYHLIIWEKLDSIISELKEEHLHLKQYPLLIPVLLWIRPGCEKWFRLAR
ncbi:MAG: DUF1730 domain-containing protein [Ignavibacteriales bacterium]|nr:DUF1730 domain-containing protein [Ignavibacteriales bacterium]